MGRHCCCGGEETKCVCGACSGEGKNAPREFAVTIAGIADAGDCPACIDLNATFILQASDTNRLDFDPAGDAVCFWESAIADSCDFVTYIILMLSLNGGTVQLDVYLYDGFWRNNYSANVLLLFRKVYEALPDCLTLDTEDVPSAGEGWPYFCDFWSGPGATCKVSAV